MADPTAIETLRQKSPALALVAGFASNQQQDQLAWLMLLWLELRHAETVASEPLLAATRISWWKQAFQTGQSDAVPLADHVIRSATAEQLAWLAEWADRRILDLIEGEDLRLGMDKGKASHRVFAKLLLSVIGLDPKDQAWRKAAESVIIKLEAALAHTTENRNTEMPGLPSFTVPSSSPLSKEQRKGRLILELLAWLAEEPLRLEYPDRYPLLALAMTWKALKGVKQARC